MSSSTLQEVDLSDPSALSLALDVLRGDRPVFLLEMPAVQALVAPATTHGAATLDSVKERLPGKTYGSIIGSLESFHGLADPAELPAGLTDAAALSCFEDAFMRVRLPAPARSTPVVRDGTHQGLLFSSPAHRRLAIQLEVVLAELAEPGLFGGAMFSAPLCTSANISGHPLGSITDEVRAAAFARERGVKLWLRAPVVEGERGSYPVFALHPDGVTLERDGPGRERIERRVRDAIG